MKSQSRTMSMIESWANIAVGLGIQMTANFIILPLFGFNVTVADVLGIAAIMTVISVIRSYGMRRVFEFFRTRNTPPFFENVILDIAHERMRQLEGEGYTAAHDDAHTEGEIASGAAAYAIAASIQARRKVKLDEWYSDAAEAGDMETLQRTWPWPSHQFKPSHTRRNLIKAAAMLVAEIGRIDRLASKSIKDAPV